LIRITPEGREKTVKAAKIIHGVNEKIQAGFEAGQIETLKEVLRGVLERCKSK
jgi:hypothetical protein